MHAHKHTQRRIVKDVLYLPDVNFLARARLDEGGSNAAKSVELALSALA